MNEMLRWSLANATSVDFHPSKWTRVLNNHNCIPKFWNGHTANKILGVKLPEHFGHSMSMDPSNTTLLGGMCLLNTAEMKKISKKEISFHSTDEFAKWYSSWYPRIDQIHDTIGIPPKFCRNIIYTSEDSFFANRLSQYTNLNREDIQAVLKDVHKNQGHAVLKKYLESFGYRGDISVIYTSEIETELRIVLKIWERLLNSRFRTCDRDFAKVEIMYTGFWLDILGIEAAVIYEPANKMILKGWLKLQKWVEEQQYGVNINHNLGIIGYLPFLTNHGDGARLSYDTVPNYQNFRHYTITPENCLWYAVNLLFAKKKVIEDGPVILTTDRINELISSDLRQYYST